MDVSNNLFNTWEKYRLSDMLRWPGVRNGTCNKNNYKCEYERYLVEFPNSIVTKYMLKLSENERNREGIELNKLKEILLSYPMINYDEKAIHMHLRIGDVCIANNDVRFKRKMTAQELCYHGLLLKYGNIEKYYCKPWCHYEGKLKECIKKGANKKIIIVCGMHTKGKGVEESKEVVRLYKLELEKRGYEVELNMGNNPDVDFVMLYRVKYFIEGGGGYGELIKICREN